MLTSNDLHELAKRVVSELGVRQTVGEVVVDNSSYAPRLKGPEWMWDDEPSYYNMSVTPLMVDFNVLTVKLTPDAAGFVYAKLDPPSNSPEVVSVGADAAVRNGLATRRPFTEPIEYPIRKLPSLDQREASSNQSAAAAGIVRFAGDSAADSRRSQTLPSPWSLETGVRHWNSQRPRRLPR
ncbi:D-alanyl-D-alanine carboxypeptidase [Lacipirellula limnantheis]|uniref:D-alanyl-D-alanine carboxypeptidase n=1 Tax=Lacipirellula limnantheis TaxID=2528024 RepID=UPI0011A4A970|nr:D-alanyl-D-alanine carboxypeptidase [Lacipirellula limnantheis]